MVDAARVVSTPYEYPVPHKFELQGIVSYGYEDEVVLFTEMTFPADMALGQVDIGLEANWLVCEVSCPGRCEFTRSIEVVADWAGAPSRSPRLRPRAASTPAASGRREHRRLGLASTVKPETRSPSRST